MKKFIIEYVIHSKLSEEELWPDGDAPENLSEEDVFRLIKESGGIETILFDWNLTLDGSLSVREIKT